MVKPVYILEQFELYFLKLLVLIERGVFSREESNTARMVLLLLKLFCNRRSSLLRFGRLQLYFGSYHFFFMFVLCTGIYCKRIRSDLNTTAFIYVDSMLAIITLLMLTYLKLKVQNPAGFSTYICKWAFCRHSLGDAAPVCLVILDIEKGVWQNQFWHTFFV